MEEFSGNWNLIIYNHIIMKTKYNWHITCFNVKINNTKYLHTKSHSTSMVSIHKKTSKYHKHIATSRWGEKMSREMLISTLHWHGNDNDTDYLTFKKEKKNICWKNMEWRKVALHLLMTSYKTWSDLSFMIYQYQVFAFHQQ